MRPVARTFILALLTLLSCVSAAQGTFPGQNGKLALETHRQQSRIGTVNPDGSGFVELTNGIAPSGGDEDAAGPAWSPDGKKLAFGSRDRLALVSRLEVMDADGSNRETIFQDTQSLYAPSVVDPTWSPDGSKILFVYRGRLFVIAASGGTPTPLLLSGDVPETFASPDWSPDGSTVAFEGQPNDEYCDPYDPPECYPILGPPAIYAVSPDVVAVTRLSEYDAEGEDPSWSPDSTRIAYYAFGVIFTIDPSGRNATSAGPHARDPVWSPDGERIAFSRPNQNGGYDLSVMHTDGSNPTKLLDGGSGFTPTYAPSSWQAITNHPPDCSGVAATPTVLWPPNKSFRVVELAGATDPDGDSVTLEVTGVTQDEPVGGSPDARARSGEVVRLRAERDPKGDGRAYRIAFRATDAKGASCEGAATAGVPRRKKHAPVDSAPPSCNSFAP